MANTTENLTKVLQSGSPAQVGQVLEQNREKLIDMPRPFAAYFRELLKQYGLTQNEVIDRAGFSQPYGYRLLSEDRRTRQRDYILRFCFAGGFRLEEIQRLLKLYGMSPLYPRIPRDAVLIAAIGSGMTDPGAVDGLLRQQGMQALRCPEM